ncbi:RNA polymerase sigma factor (sigma-70 family) [Micromonospora jinlongensis]|uniref:RNA polymerase sigma factor (Sigma-70 family) n=1 Tax=Micromonospora jinlongensis TaxID=1287877 RepID=A0A7Y9X511_9ACTN|nr:sigma-70 family RNA polymerase sigma factor [Micromonospora jinlongensis]NYH45304.1 RNA polymerase sigma factor (sigma-70 family) [Micromonospora jinlongensis]
MSVTYHAYPNRTDMSAVVDAARRGDQAAMDELVSHYLPLVYNIVGRALNRSSDVDDVVQNTMLKVVRGLAGVRDPRLFRSWLVAVTMNEVRAHRQDRHTTPTPSEDIDNLVVPGSDFEDLTLTQLRLSDQRREVVLATRWLDDDHRHLLSLWWLVEAGHLSRADLVDALQLDPHHVTVRVARMKAQLDTARLVVRALFARPGCAGLIDTASDWDGQPAPVWRKRLARHIRDCPHCPNATSDLVPAERLLAGLALTPVPVSLASDVTRKAYAATGASQGAAGAGTHAKTGILQQARSSALSLPKTLVGAFAAVALVGGGGLVVAHYTDGSPQRPASATGSQPSAASTEAAAEADEPAPASPSPSAPDPSSATASPTPTRSATPSKSPKPTSSPTKTATKSASASTGVSAAEQRLLVLLNERRRALGLTEVKMRTTEQRAAEACVKQNLDAGGLAHCGHEVLFASTGNSSPEQIINAWFNSPGHKTALTYASSRYAGPAIAYNGSRQIAAINIDY